MNTERKIILALAAVIAAGGGAFLVSWHRSEIALAKAEVFSQAKQQIIEDNSKSIRLRDDAFIADRADYQAAIQKITSAALARQSIAAHVPSGGAIAEAKREDLSPALAAKLPDSPSYSIVPEDKMVAIARDEKQCEQDRDELGKCKATRLQLESSLKSAQEDVANWKRAAKGSWKRKLMRGAECGAIVGVGALAGQAAAQKRGLVAGAGIGAGICAIVF